MKKFLYDEKIRALAFQVLGLFSVLGLFAYLFFNTQANLEKQNIATGFGFLQLEAGFDIGESLIEYWSDDTYLKAIWVGILNTLKVSVLGNILAVGLGIFVGLGYLSKNWMIRKSCKVYIETLRNLPLLLQLFFWYAVLSESLPSVKNAISILPHTFLTNRGLYVPFPEDSFTYGIAFISLILSIAAFFFLEKKRDESVVLTGVEKPLWQKLNYLIYLVPILVWAMLGSPSEFSIPQLRGFNFTGGYNFSPEFCALLLGLVIYTSAFNAEITRAGIESIDKGQWEASHSLSLSQKDTVKLIILPQALRVMVPPLTSQILNLTKNSSLAVAIGYPDFVSITNTAMNQTGQAIECVFIIMAVYLVFSLTTSVFMNWFNKKFSIVER